MSYSTGDSTTRQSFSQHFPATKHYLFVLVNVFIQALLGIYFNLLVVDSSSLILTSALPVGSMCSYRKVGGSVAFSWIAK